LTSKVAIEEHKIGSTDPNIAIGNHCMDRELHFGMPCVSRHYDDEGYECEERDAIATASQRRWAATELERFEVGTSYVDWYEGEDRNNVHADALKEAS